VKRIDHITHIRAYLFVWQTPRKKKDEADNTHDATSVQLEPQSTATVAETSNDDTQG
jgi:hypothetical protein